MKKIKLLLIIISILLFTSCNKNFEFTGCGIITYEDVSCNEYGCYYDIYLIPENSNKEIIISVDERTYITYNIGDNVCFDNVPAKYNEK
ncbi:hypothetical protein M0Q50_07285 [bacterium]|jgi:hypothetical protein|nr:hypothetical protein [bacterium]